MQTIVAGPRVSRWTRRRDRAKRGQDSMAEDDEVRTIGWLGTGRMGAEMVGRLLAAGCDVAVYNRTRAKAEPLEKLGAKLASPAADLGTRDIVFVTAASSEDLISGGLGPAGLMSQAAAPAAAVDCA